MSTTIFDIGIITMDTYKIGYYIGWYATEGVLYVAKAKLAVSGFMAVDRAAKMHKINCNDTDAVSNNLMKCIEYIDW